MTKKYRPSGERKHGTMGEKWPVCSGFIYTAIMVLHIIELQNGFSENVGRPAATAREDTVDMQTWILDCISTIEADGVA